VDQRNEPNSTDVLPPHTTFSISPQPNSAGWNNSDVTITLSAQDEPGGSGVQFISANLSGAQSASTVFSANVAGITITREGSTTLTYFAADVAGNKEKRKAITVRLDKTPPVVAPVRTPAPNINGWNNTDVSISFTCTDALSGVAAGSVTGPITVSNEGANQQATGTCSDIAGNVASATVTGINIDKSPPIIGGLPVECILWPPDHKFVQVATVSASDTPAGLAAFNVNVGSNETGGDQPEFIVSGGALQPQVVQLRAERLGSGSGRTYTITATAADLAGNSTTSSATCIVPHDQSGHSTSGGS
jgi:hypothetical protein